MKNSLWLFTSLLLATSLAAAQRLPELAVPENYKLTFAPDFNKDNFAGDETISVKVLKSTSEIVLNSAEIEFRSATITSGETTQNAAVTTDKVKEFATLTVPNAIPAGPATIHITYTGILNGDLRGFYLGKESNGKKYAVTQFESTDARRAFPSFDEPAYKATADITVIADKGQTVISNREVISDNAGPGPDKHTVKFATTAKMSSYLYAVAVGDFEYLEGSADGIPIRVYTFPGRKQQAAFSSRSGRTMHQVLRPLFWSEVRIHQTRPDSSARLRCWRHGKCRSHYFPRSRNVALTTNMPPPTSKRMWPSP